MHRRIQLRKHLHNIPPNEFGNLADLRASARSPSQRLLIVSCADHGLAPDMISFARPGDCAVIQNLAASIPRSETPLGSTMASIEYAIARQGVTDVVVCTHLCCSVLRHWIRMPNLSDVSHPGFRFIRDARDAVDLFYRYTTQSERQTLMTCEHTLYQLENLRSHGFVRQRLKSGLLRLHGWVVDDTTARVMAYQPPTHQFVSIERTVMQKRLIE